jgi:hypothetical protein
LNLQEPRKSEKYYFFGENIFLRRAIFPKLNLSCQRLKYASGYKTGVLGIKEVIWNTQNPYPQPPKTLRLFLDRFFIDWQPNNLPNHRSRMAG